MIRIYILEDDPSIIHNLTQIITGEKLGIICGDSADGMPSTAEILATRPDVIMLDFFMPQRDGIEVVTDLRAQGCTAKCIMLSQVSEKTLIGKAYSAGVDFFISKPINLLEVRGVIQNASRQVENERTLANIRSMFSNTSSAQPAPPSDETQRLRRVQNVLGSLGMSGEKGSADILKMCGYLYENHLTVAQTSVGQLCEALCPPPRTWSSGPAARWRPAWSIWPTWAVRILPTRPSPAIPAVCSPLRRSGRRWITSAAAARPAARSA